MIKTEGNRDRESEAMIKTEGNRERKATIKKKETEKERQQ